MRENNATNDLLDAVAKVLLRCFLLGYLFLIVWFAAYVLAGDWIYQINNRFFGITQHEINQLHLFGITFTKVCLFLFFFFPYVAIRLVLRKRGV